MEKIIQFIEYYKMEMKSTKRKKEMKYSSRSKNAEALLNRTHFKIV